MYDKERAEMAAGLSGDWIRCDAAATMKNPLGPMDLADAYADAGLRMADRIIAACTTAGAVVGDTP